MCKCLVKYQEREKERDRDIWTHAGGDGSEIGKLRQESVRGTDDGEWSCEKRNVSHFLDDDDDDETEVLGAHDDDDHDRMSALGLVLVVVVVATTQTFVELGGRIWHT